MFIYHFTLFSLKLSGKTDNVHNTLTASFIGYFKMWKTKIFQISLCEQVAGCPLVHIMLLKHSKLIICAIIF